MRVSTARWIQVAIAGAALAELLGLSSGESTVERWQLAARFTARWSFPLFLLAFTARSCARLWPGDWTRALLRARRGVGLGFATAHTVHLGALVTYELVAGATPSPLALVLGGGAYLMMFAMAATSNDAAVRWLGPRWRRLHAVGAWWLLLVFVLTYAGRVADGHPALALQVALALAAVGLRIAARRARPVPVTAAA